MNRLDIYPEDALIALIDDWRVRQRPVMSRAKACRWLVSIAITTMGLTKRMEIALARCRGQAGLPDPADACRHIIATVNEALGDDHG